MVHAVDAGAGIAQLSLHFELRRKERALGIAPPTDARLVGDYDAKEASALESNQRLRGARQYADVIGPADVAAILDQGAVPVKKHRRAQRG